MNTKIKAFPNEKWVKVDFGSPTKTCHYEISNFGRIKSTDKRSGKENLLKGAKVRGGLIILNTKLKNEKAGCVYIHRFVAENFVKKSTKDLNHIIHKNFDLSHNKWTNLKWVSEEEWKLHINKKPTMIEGREKRNRSYKLNATKVGLMKKMLAKGKTKTKIIAKNFGVTERHVKRIEKGHYWSNIKPEK